MLQHLRMARTNSLSSPTRSRLGQVHTMLQRALNSLLAAERPAIFIVPGA